MRGPMMEPRGDEGTGLLDCGFDRGTPCCFGAEGPLFQGRRAHGKTLEFGCAPEHVKVLLIGQEIAEIGL